MKRGPYKYHCCVSRLNEFFDWEELDYFLYNIRNNNMDQHKAIQWLDIRVRFDYATGRDRDPHIQSRLLEYLINNGLSID